MNVGTLKDSTKKWTRRLAVPMLALALVTSFVSYEFAKPTPAKAADAAPAAAPLDADSVGALLALDKAMETLAARVTPAVVNVTVTSRTKPETAGKRPSPRWLSLEAADEVEPGALRTVTARGVELLWTPSARSTC